MEFNEKLLTLRKQKGLTQEELAKSLYVSRTAVSKWESGRGYPEIESIRAIARFFSVTVDSLLSPDEILTVAERSEKQERIRCRDLAFGLLDICASLLFFLPLFADRMTDRVASVSLLALSAVQLYLKTAYFIAVILMCLCGVAILALQGREDGALIKSKTGVSFSLSLIASMLFILSLQPYPAVFTLSLLAVKTFMLLKK